ncbi:MAG: immunoglobulin domain-containing protein [Arachnia sp.]
MSHIKRWFAVAASGALLLGLGVPATSYADEAVAAPTNHAGPCVGDTGVTMVIDFQKLGGGAEVRCFTGDPEDGVEAIRGAGFEMQGVDQWGDAFICRIDGRPAVDEIVPIDEDPTYTEKCVRTPPANGYWSYWHSDDQGANWEYSNLGAMGYEPEQGEWEGWSFSLNATSSTNPEPRTGLALAAYDNVASATAAADWIAGQWDADATHSSAGLADNVMALAAAEAHPEVISEMVRAMTTTDLDYYSRGADSLAKMLIALEMTGQDTNNFLGCDRDLTAELDTFIADDAPSLNNWWGPHLVTIALNRLDKAVPQNVWDLLMNRQKVDGGFGSPDDTGLALSALVGTSENELNPQAMRDAADVAITKALDWANDSANQKTQDGDYFWSTFSPANSTGILAGALAEAGEDISSPQAFLRAQQKLTGTGAFSNVLNGTTSNGMSTTQAIFAVAGKAYGEASFEVEQVTSACAVAPAFTTQPESITVAAGDTATFTVAATGDPEPGITWEKDVNGTWTAIKDATGTTLTLPNVDVDSDGLRVRAVATNAKDYAVSEIAVLTVNTVATTPPVTTPPVTTPPVTSPPAPSYPGDIYTTPGYHSYNDRSWFTSCEPYSATQRCRTLISAKTVSESNGTFTTSQKWVFNNLTYLPAKKSTWAGNPLASQGQWTAADGREWRTECNTAVTGGNGCRSYVTAQIIANVAKAGEPVRYQWVTKEIFNNIVQFS